MKKLEELRSEQASLSQHFIADQNRLAAAPQPEQDERERAHLLEGARILMGRIGDFEYMSEDLPDDVIRWVLAERARLSAAVEPATSRTAEATPPRR